MCVCVWGGGGWWPFNRPVFEYLHYCGVHVCVDAALTQSEPGIIIVNTIACAVS